MLNNPGERKGDKWRTTAGFETPNPTIVADCQAGLNGEGEESEVSRKGRFFEDGFL